MSCRKQIPNGWRLLTSVWSPSHVCGRGIFISQALGQVRTLNRAEIQTLTDAGLEYKVPNQSESLTWSSSGLMRTMGPSQSPGVNSVVLGWEKNSTTDRHTVSIMHPLKLEHESAPGPLYDVEIELVPFRRCCQFWAWKLG